MCFDSWRYQTPWLAKLFIFIGIGVHAFDSVVFFAETFSTTANRSFAHVQHAIPCRFNGETCLALGSRAIEFPSLDRQFATAEQ